MAEYDERLREKLEKEYPNFCAKIALSREKTEKFSNGYITDFVNKDFVAPFTEGYLC